MSEQKTYSVNQAVGKQPGVGFIPPNQLFFWGIFIAIALFLQNFYRLDLLSTVCLWAVFAFSFWLLTGSKSHQYFDRFAALLPFQRVWRRAKVRWKWSRAGLPIKEQVGIDGRWSEKLFNPRTEVYAAIEDKLDLVTYGEFRLHGNLVGFYYNKKGWNPAHVVMRWRVKPIHSIMSDADADKLLTDWATALKNLAPGEDFTFEFTCEATDKERQQELDKHLNAWRRRPESERNRVIEALIESDKVRTRSLTKDGFRRVKEIFVTATYTPERAMDDERDPLSLLLRYSSQALQGMFEFLAGQRQEMSHQRLQERLIRAYQKGFKRYHKQFTELMKIEATPMTYKDNWEQDNKEIHQSDPPNVSHLLVLDEKGLHVERDEKTGHLHATTLLFRGEGGKSSVPIVSPEWIYLPLRRKYVGFMEIDYLNLKDASSHDVTHFLERIPVSEEGYDSRIVVQFSTAPKEVHKFSLERLTRNAKYLLEGATKRKDENVAAEGILTDAKEAQRKIQQGNKFLQVSAGIFLYRSNPEALDQDFAAISDLFPTMNPYRERNKVFEVWLQSLPYVEQPFLRSSMDRASLYLSCEAVWLLPLVSITNVDRRGLELVALRDGSPIYLDAFSPERHFRFLLLAEPRSGKSVWMAVYIFYALIHRQPVLVFDVVRSDGSSTYSDLVEIVRGCGGKAAYYEAGEKSINILHDYDFSGFDAKQAKDRQELLWDIRIRLTVAIGVGNRNDSQLEDAIRDIVIQSLPAFYDQPQIKARFAAANRAGIGTKEWLNSPTYHDYLEFLNPWLEQYFHANGNTLPTYYKDAAGTLVQKLRTCLNSKIGRAIASPSDFDYDLDLLVFALVGQYTPYEFRILALSAQAALLSRALTVSVSHFLADECPQLMPDPSFASWVGSLATNGPKSGIRLGLISQYPKVIFESVAGDAIAQTLNAVLVGHIHKRVIPTLVKYLDFNPEFLLQCAMPDFKPDAMALRSHWLLEVDGKYTFCGSYPSELLLALTANNFEESRARERFLEYYKDDPVLGLIVFCKAYVMARRTKTPMEKLQPEDFASTLFSSNALAA